MTGQELFQGINELLKALFISVFLLTAWFCMIKYLLKK